MLDFEEDMTEVFFGGDFAARFVRHRAGATPKDVVGILGIADEEALEGRALTSARQLRAPALSDVLVNDVLEVVDELPAFGIQAGTRFRVLDKPRRVNDGAEMEALLGSVSA